MKHILLVLFCGLLFWGCSTQTVVTYKILAVTENPVGSKVGQIDQVQGGIMEAAKNGGITLINTVSKQNTDKYTTYYWPLLFVWAGGTQYTLHTFHKEEIIVTGD
ncbi:MAG: hypothetical protein LBH44_09625 [Treponema sp.]|jgi:hypothetical protein|nr:hypothetical protein [Treponema sp.]